MRKCLTGFAAFLAPFLLFAQTEIGGVVNRYAAVESIDFCTAELTLSTVDGFAPGDEILIIQMKGAQVSVEESSAFGDLLDPGAAGRFERARISAVDGQRLTLENTLLYEYDPGGGVQAVRIAKYEDAVLNSPLEAPVWNGATGGVLIVEVNGTLQLEAGIDLSERGFRGGLSDVIQDTECSFLTAIRDYGVDRSSWKGAPKGEGIGVTIDKENGRGPQANGGGGGNDHNSGGGGGANVTPGGGGGENRQSGFGCDGNFPGLGGKAAPIDPLRLYAGGGGGGGHENNDNGSDGGHGGGIILLFANTIIGNNQVIRSNGGSPATTFGDGAGGGGAGGTIVIQAEQIDGPLRVEATGGNGGFIDNRNDDRCFGPGGGGSGGRVLTNQAGTLGIDVSGGNAGQSINSTQCNDGPNGAQPGSDGLIAPFEGLPQSEEKNEAPAIVGQVQPQSACSGDIIRLSLETVGAGRRFQWQVDRGSGFTDLTDDATYQGTQSDTLIITGLAPEMNDYRYRLLLSNDCFADIRSEPIPVSIIAPPEARFEFTQDVLTVFFNNQSSEADSYQWDFGDGNSSDTPSPSHTYQEGGQYSVRLIARSDCGADTATTSITVIGRPSAAFNAAPSNGCAPLEVRFQNSSSGENASFTWRFPGGEPASSIEPSPLVRYAAGGIYDVELIATNELGSDTLLRRELIVVETTPQADFEAATNLLELQLTNTSSGAGQYEWDFGDGNTSTASSPTHAYQAPGEYTVTLVAVNNCGRDTASQTILAGQPPVADFSFDRANGCIPHTVQFADASTGVFDSFEWQFPGGEPGTSTDPNPTVIYRQEGDYDVTLRITGALGANSVTRSAVIKIRNYPIPAFNYEITGPGEVRFSNLSSGADTYRWEFGDGQFSQLENPVHTYDSSGVFEVTLNAENESCASAVNQTVAILLTSRPSPALPPDLNLFPNPTSDLLYLESEHPGLWPLRCRVFNAQGQLLLEQNLPGNGALNLSQLPAGTYLLQVRSEKQTWVSKISVIH